ncbi:MAG: peptidyl-prolyl cis-trans isomerase [Actinomycetota bacterium]|nr:peptidyl-prolyl cis-trans isomerase [Actinomycetota bacterium]
MSPSKREREYARRRYDKWQEKLTTRVETRRRRRRIGLTLSAVLALLAVTGGIVVLVNRDSEGTDEAASQTPSASASASDTASPSATSTEPNPCPTPSVKPPAEPLSFDKAPAKSTAQGKAWKVTMTTSCGPVVMQLDGAAAPQAVASTVFLSQKKFYDGTPCHRLTTQGIFVLQCGDPTGKGTGGPGFSYGPIENAPKNNTYPAGTIAMARQGGDGKSMGSQFFLVYKESRIPSDDAGGYTIMGKITEGLDIVQKIADGGASGASGDGAPNRPISIVSTAVAAG